MKKLSLNVDELEVTSFDVVAPGEEKATARFGWSDESVCPTVTEGGPKCGSRPPY